ncbi:hypothetical protein LINPERHAP1_LOCUS25407 [Linum perenne]
MFEAASSSYCSFFHPGVFAVNVGLASIDAILAFLAFYQLIRIHSRNSRLGWTRQKVFHVLIGSSNIGYFVYFAASPIAYHYGWLSWSYSCGFILMTFSKILFLSTFLLLLSFWVDLCHQADDDDYEEEDFSFHEPFLEVPPQGSHRVCFPFRSIHVGSRQRVVIQATAIAFVLTMTCAVLFWIDMSNGFTHSSLLAAVYEDIVDVAMLLLGGALACYGKMLLSPFCTIFQYDFSSYPFKILRVLRYRFPRDRDYISLTIMVSFQVRYNWQQLDGNGLLTSLLLTIYYFIGSCVPSAFLLWIMIELPHPLASNVREESSTITFIRDSEGRGVVQSPQRWTTSASLQNQVSRASPI